MHEIPPPAIKPVLYEVSLLPEDDINHNLFALTVQDRGHGKWAVIHSNSCLGSDGTWDFGVKEYDRGDEWLQSHRFDLETALRLASEVAPHVTVNGQTAAQVYLRQREAAARHQVELKNEQAIQFGDGRLSAHFWKRVQPADNGCWLWKLKPAANGYGRYRINNVRSMAHRFIYTVVVGPIPEGMQVDHVCHNIDLDCAGGPSCLHRRCVNPAHLEAVTGSVNTRRYLEPRQDAYCGKGHPFDVVNTGYTARGSRFCRACQNASNRTRRAAQRG